MENDHEISSSTLSFGSMPARVSNEPEASPDHLSLTNLSLSLERLLLDPGLGYTDAYIVVDDVAVGIHRCLLAARSDFFHGLFSKQPCNDSEEGGKPKYYMSKLVASTQGYVGLEAFDVVLKYLYTGKMVQSPPEVSTCVDDQCSHEACRPAIDYAIELLHAFSNFHIKEPLSLVQRHLRDFVNKACIDDVIPILVASFRCNSQQLMSACIFCVSLSDLDDMVIEKEVPTVVWHEIKRLRDEAGIALLPRELSHREKRIKRIHKALDSDDVELLSLLLSESNITLNDAFALHYAVAYSDSKVVKKLLELKQADLNLKNSRGFTALHVAARRKVPSILGALIENGACAFETTPDGQTALRITRRLTRPKDYNQNLQKGKESNKDKVCIDLLERAMKNASASGSRLMVPSEVTADDLHELEYFEGRVKIATMLFPTEAMAAMEMAEAEWTTLYKSLALKGSWKTGKDVGQKETAPMSAPMSAAELRQKLQVLRKTVEIGERYFPNCSEKIMTFSDIDMPDALYLERGTEEEKELKKRRYNELREDFLSAFDKDMAANNMPSSSFPNRSSSPTTSSTSSSVPRNRSRNKTRVKVCIDQDSQMK